MARRSYKKRTMRKKMKGGLYACRYFGCGGGKKRTMRKKMRGGMPCYNYGGKVICP